MIKVYYAILTETPDAQRLTELVQTLLPEQQLKIMSYRHRLDQYGRLISKLLLLKLLNDCYPGNNISINTLKKTGDGVYYYQSENDCSISYTGEVVICAYGQQMRTGADIELLRHTDVNLFKDYFSPIDWQHIQRNISPLRMFYQYWVRKEAFLKATGRGVFEALDEYDVTSNIVRYNNTSYYLHDVTLPGFAVAVATDKQVNGIELIKTDIAELIYI